jgi:hypothetical protein
MNNLKASVEDYHKIYKMLNENDNLKIDLDFIKECFLNVEDLTKELNLIADNNNLNNKKDFVTTQKKILNVLKNLSVAHDRLQYFFLALTISNCKEKNISNEIEVYLPEINPELKEINYKKIKEISEKFEYMLDEKTKISQLFYSIGSNINQVKFIIEKDLDTLNAYNEYNNENNEFDSKLIEQLIKLYHRFKAIKNKEYENQNEFKEFMETECNSENFQAYIYLNEIKNNFNELKLLDIKVNNKELYNKNRMIRIVEESEFYFEYDENNIEFKNNKRDFYKIK